MIHAFRSRQNNKTSVSCLKLKSIHYIIQSNGSTYEMVSSDEVQKHVDQPITHSSLCYTNAHCDLIGQLDTRWLSWLSPVLFLRYDAIETRQTDHFYANSRTFDTFLCIEVMTPNKIVSLCRSEV